MYRNPWVTEEKSIYNYNLFDCYSKSNKMICFAQNLNIMDN